MEHQKPNPPESAPESAHAGHEVGQVAPRSALIFTVCFLGTLALMFLIACYALKILNHYQSAENSQAFPPSPFASLMAAIPPDPRVEPQPSHDVMPHVDLTEVRAAEQGQIGPDNWRWVDPSRRFARIPLQQAIDLAVENGLPELLPATQPTTQPFMPPASALHGPGGVP